MRWLAAVAVGLVGCTGAIAPESTSSPTAVETEETGAIGDNADGEGRSLAEESCPEGSGSLTIFSTQVEGDNDTNLFYRIRFRNNNCDDVQVVETNALPETKIPRIGVGSYTAEIFYLDDSSGEDIQVGATTAAFEIRSGEETAIDLGFPGG